jgi:hypothetical protein
VRVRSLRRSSAVSALRSIAFAMNRFSYIRGFSCHRVCDGVSHRPAAAGRAVVNSPHGTSRIARGK